MHTSDQHGCQRHEVCIESALVGLRGAAHDLLGGVSCILASHVFLAGVHTGVVGRLRGTGGCEQHAVHACSLEGAAVRAALQLLALNVEGHQSA